jgi:HEAT repeat protein
MRGSDPLVRLAYYDQRVISFLLLAAFLSYSPHPPKPASQLEKAWSLLEQGVHNKSADQRSKAVDALSLLHNPKSEAWAEAALSDPQPDVRVSTANTLAKMEASAARPKLRQALKDPEAVVVVAVANALYALKDPMASEVYYALLTGERKTSDGLVKSQLDQLRNTKYLEKLAFQTGLGLVPFGGMGYQAWQTLTASDSSVVRALAAERLAKDPDAKTIEALRAACGDKKWHVRAAAVSALGRSGVRSQGSFVAFFFYDDNDMVRYAAAVAFINLKTHYHSRSRPSSPV